MAKFIDLTGKVFGKLTVIERDNSKKRVSWLCVCDCDNKNIRSICTSSLLSGMTKSCGCLRGKNSGRRGRKDLTGMVFGKLTVLEKVLNPPDKRKGFVYWKCQCDCDEKNIKIVEHFSLLYEHTKSCGCLVHGISKFSDDLTGSIFGRWLVLGRDLNKRGHSSYWLCKCSCEKQTERSVVRYTLTSGKSTSCGCIGAEKVSIRNTTHGQSQTRLYKIWVGMHKRCYNPNCKSYDSYGGSGIKVCEEWHEFEPFQKWASENGYNDELTIHRFPNLKGDYCPENCVWADWVRQGREKLNNNILTANGKTQCLQAWADELNCDSSAIIHRFNAEWTLEDALTIPIKPNCGPKDLTLYGITKKATEWGKEYNIPSYTILRRINSGWNIEEAIITPVRIKKK